MKICKFIAYELYLYKNESFKKVLYLFYIEMITFGYIQLNKIQHLN